MHWLDLFYKRYLFLELARVGNTVNVRNSLDFWPYKEQCFSSDGAELTASLLKTTERQALWEGQWEPWRSTTNRTMEVEKSNTRGERASKRQWKWECVGSRILGGRLSWQRPGKEQDDRDKTGGWFEQQMNSKTDTVEVIFWLEKRMKMTGGQEGKWEEQRPKAWGKTQ